MPTTSGKTIDSDGWDQDTDDTTVSIDDWIDYGRIDMSKADDILRVAGIPGKAVAWHVRLDAEAFETLVDLAEKALSRNIAWLPLRQSFCDIFGVTASPHQWGEFLEKFKAGSHEQGRSNPTKVTRNNGTKASSPAGKAARKTSSAARRKSGATRKG